MPIAPGGTLFHRPGELPQMWHAQPAQGPGPSAPATTSSSKLPDLVTQYVSDLRKLFPLIDEVKAGLATPSAIAKRPGDQGGVSSFSKFFNLDGSLKPASANASARSLHKKLDAIGQSDQHRHVAESFKAATDRQARQPRLEQDARDLERLIPLIGEVKDGKATPLEISKRKGQSSFANAFNRHGTLRPASNSNAQSILNKLQLLQESGLLQYQKVAESFKAAMAQQAQQSPLERVASDLEKLIPLILEVKAGKATPSVISRRAGMSSSFAYAFGLDGNLRSASGNGNVQSIRQKLHTLRQSGEPAHQELVKKFEETLALRQQQPGKALAPAEAPSDTPLAINDFVARRHELARLILQIRQGAVSLADAEPIFPGLSQLIRPSGFLRSDPELGLVFQKLALKEQQDLFNLLPAVDKLLLPGALPQGQSSASAAQAAAPDLPGPAAAAPSRPTDAPSRPTFDLNLDPAADIPQPPVPAARPVKLEPIALAPAARVPLLVEAQLDQARTAFYEELAQVCDLTGDAAQWSTRTRAVIVHHRMEPVPGNDDKFPLRDRNNPERAHPRYANDDGTCHPNVQLKTIKVAGQEMHKFLQHLCESDPRVRLDPDKLKDVVQALTKDAQHEFERLIREEPSPNPRCQPIKLSAADVQDHEHALIGQYGLFVPRPDNQADYPTLSNGRILGFYMGAVLENERQRQEALATHPDSDHYALDASRLPQQRQPGRTNWSSTAGKRTQVTFAGLGSANSMAFANTALRRPDPDHPEPAFDRERINALFMPFDLKLIDKNGKRRNEVAVALVALDNLFPEGDDRPRAQVLADYGDAYLANFSKPAPAPDSDDTLDVKPRVASPESPQRGSVRPRES